MRSAGDRRRRDSACGERGVVGRGALARVLAGGAAGDEERPVGALEREQLAQGALRRPGHPARRSSALRCVQASPVAPPGAQVAALAPARRLDASGAGAGFLAAETGTTSASSSTASSDVTPSCQKWPKSSVSKATTECLRPGARRTAGRGRERGPRRVGVVGRAVVGPAGWARGVSRCVSR